MMRHFRKRELLLYLALSRTPTDAVDGLVVRRKNRFRITTNGDHDLPVAANVLDRQFKLAASNKVWATDITYIWACEGWVYLAVVIDLYAHRAIGWQQSARIDTDLVSRALEIVIGQRNPR